MRAAIGCVAALTLLAVAPALAAGRLTPNEIQATFFNGQPFTASAQNISYKMVFTADGKMTREPAGKRGAKSEGTWKLSKDGYCTTWKGDRQNCYVVTASGDNKWSVMRGTTAMATWTK